VERDIPSLHQQFFMSENKMNLPFIRYKNVTIHAFDGPTDDQTALRSQIPRCILLVGPISHILERGTGLLEPV